MKVDVSDDKCLTALDDAIERLFVASVVSPVVS